MRITSVETMRSPLQPNVCTLVLRTDDGIEGIGETFWGAGAVEAHIHEALAPALLRIEDPTPEGVARQLRPYVGFAGSGAETRAAGAVDIALWDLLGKSAGLPVARLLGGSPGRKLRVYNTCAGSAYVKNGPQQASGNWGLADGLTEAPYEDLDGFLRHPKELAQSLLDEGYTAMKIWPFDRVAEASGGMDITARHLADGLWVLEQIREAVGDAMDIMVELHGLWSLKSAIVLVRELERFSPYWVEDPLRPDGVDLYRALRDSTSVPIAVGETLAGQRAYLALLEARAIDVAIVDISWCGGLTEARKIASLADAYGVPVAPHDCSGPVSFAACSHFAVSQPNTLIAESVRAFQNGWYMDMVSQMPRPVRGWISCSDVPGLGVSLSPDYVEDSRTRHRVTDSARVESA